MHLEAGLYGSGFASLMKCHRARLSLLQKMLPVWFLRRTARIIGRCINLWQIVAISSPT